MKLERETETCHRYGSKYRLSLFSSQLDSQPDLAPAMREKICFLLKRMMMMMMFITMNKKLINSRGPSLAEI